MLLHNPRGMEPNIDLCPPALIAWFVRHQTSTGVQSQASGMGSRQCVHSLSAAFFGLHFVPATNDRQCTSTTGMLLRRALGRYPLGPWLTVAVDDVELPGFVVAPRAVAPETRLGF